jgi:CHAD domain-containing protein
VKEAFPKLLSYLSESEQSSQKEFHEFMPGLEFRKLYKTSDDLINELKSIPPKKLDKQLFTFIKSRIDECYDYMFEIDYSVHLHQIRKYLKQIRFVVGEQIGNIYSYFDEEVNFNDTKKVEDILGDWHDRDEFSNLLLEFETIHQDKLTEEDKKKQEKYKRAVEKDINTDIQKLRPELLHLFSLMKATMEKQVKP